MYKCYDCGHIFDEGEEKYIGDGWKEPIEAVCPVCKGNFVEAVRCNCCKGVFLEEELEDGFCQECIDEKLNEYRFGKIQKLYLICSDEKEKVELNPFIAYMFSESQINELLLRELIESDKIKKIDCFDFIKEDMDWFIDKIMKKERR